MAISLRPGLTLYFCRHGETEANLRKQLQGQTRDSALTPLGIEQARAVGKILSAQGATDVDYVSSPLQRARSTIEIVRATIGLPPDLYRIDARLIEANFGSWDGLTLEEARRREPDAYQARQRDKWNVTDAGGRENYSQVAARAESFVDGLVADTCAVSHGVWTRVLRGLFAEMSWQEMSDLDEPQGVLFRARGRTVKLLDPA